MMKQQAQPGDRVTMENVWKYTVAFGVVEKVTSDYIVVKWDDIPGHWHYTEEQAKGLETVNESR